MLNQPGPAQISHSNHLLALIKQEIIEANGWISFEHYMDLALYAPGLGYYSVGTEKLGGSGDFITAPMLGQQFANCLAKQSAEIKSNITGCFDVVEFGAGTGRLALDFLMQSRFIESVPDRYIIVETSPDLKDRQKALFDSEGIDFKDLVFWSDTFPEENFQGIVIANEVLDAMPTIRFEIGQDNLAYPIGVSVEGEGLSLSASNKPLPEILQNKLSDFSLPEGYQSEYGRRGQAWVRSLAGSIKLGVVLLIDYGFAAREFYHPDRQQGTLMCHHQHIAHGDSLFYPGLQDITAHVDFSAIADIAQSTGMDVAGYCNQGSFLLSLGVLDNLTNSQKCKQNSKQSFILSQEIKKLTLPHEMGELFKVIALSKNYEIPLLGFSMQEHSGRL